MADISDKTKDLTEFLPNEVDLKLIMDVSPIGFSISRYDNGRIVYANSSLARMYGSPAEEFLGSKSIDYCADQEEFRKVIDRLKQRRSVTNHEIELKRANGSTIWCQVNMVVTLVDSRKMVSTWFSDISKNRCNRFLLEHMASQDPLTGLANRRRFREFMGEAIARARRLRMFCSLLYLDLDGFKVINDNFGHCFGDYLLQQTSKRINLNLRETDFVARLGGDEFAVVFESPTDRTHPKLVAQKILDNIKMPYENEGQQTTVGASIGIAHFGSETLDIDAIIRRADRAMYRAKNGGKGGICVYDPTLDGS